MPVAAGKIQVIQDCREHISHVPADEAHALGLRHRDALAGREAVAPGIPIGKGFGHVLGQVRGDARGRPHALAGLQVDIPTQFTNHGAPDSADHAVALHFHAPGVLQHLWHTMHGHVDVPGSTLLTLISRYVEPARNQPGHAPVELFHMPLEQGPVGHVGLIGEGEEGVYPCCLAEMTHTALGAVSRPFQVRLPTLLRVDLTAFLIEGIGLISQLTSNGPRHQRPNNTLDMAIAKNAAHQLESAACSANEAITTYNPFHRSCPFQDWSSPRECW